MHARGLFAAARVVLMIWAVIESRPLMAATRDDAQRMEEYAAAVASSVPEQARAVLPQIDGAPRQLLALRGYLRAADTLAARWSWSAQQIDAYQATHEYAALLAEIARVRARFEANNPGYSLYANTQTRSLDVQLQRWNENVSVDAIASRLYRDAALELRAAGYPPQPDAPATRRFVQFLRNWQPFKAIPLAAPGLSLHGQSRAIDFQVMQGKALIAGTQTADVAMTWERSGWARKLQQAIAGSSFIGPLRSPNEPWHYEYAPPRTQM